MSDREARYKRRMQEDARKIRQLEEALEQAVGQLEAMGDYEQIKADNEELTKAITEGAYRAEFDAAAKKAGIDPRYVEDLWKLAPPEIDPEKDPDPKALLKHVKEAAKGRKVWLRDEDEEEDEDDGQADDETEDGEDDEDDEENDGFKLFDDEDDEDDETEEEDEAPPMKARPTAGKPTQAKGQPAGKPAPASKSKGTQPAPPRNGKPSKPAPKLPKGEGAGRGTRDNHKAEDFYADVDKDFAETGRNDPFRL